MKFHYGLKPYLKNKISIMKLGVYLEVVDKALIEKRDYEELYQYREQQKKRNRSDSSYGNHVQKKFSLNRNQSKGKAAQNSDIFCPTYGKRHGNMPCYRETGACFSCGKQGHMIRDCPEKTKLIVREPKDDNMGDRQKPKAQGRVFSMTHRDTQATFDVVTSTLRIHTLFARVLINLGSTHSFVSVSFVGLLDMHVTTLDFDLIVATPMGDSIVASKMLKN